MKVLGPDDTWLPRGLLPFVLGITLGTTATAAKIWRDRALAPPPAPLEAPAPAVEVTKTISLFDWTGTGKLGDLLVCTCEPGRIAPAPTPKRAGKAPPP